MELTPEDKQRIEQEAFKRVENDSSIEPSLHNFAAQQQVKGAEYATLYEREEQAKVKPVLLTDALKQASKLLLDGDEGYKLERVAELIQLEAERSELRNKVEGRMKQLKEFQKTINIPPGWIQKEIDFLNSLKTK